MAAVVEEEAGTVTVTGTAAAAAAAAPRCAARRAALPCAADRRRTTPSRAAAPPMNRAPAGGSALTRADLAESVTAWPAVGSSTFSCSCLSLQSGGWSHMGPFELAAVFKAGQCGVVRRIAELICCFICFCGMRYTCSRSLGHSCINLQSSVEPCCTSYQRLTPRL